jgi:hypothetical protein
LCKTFSVLAALGRLSFTKGANKMKTRSYFLSNFLLRLMLAALMLLGLFTGSPTRAQTNVYLYVNDNSDFSVKRYDAQTGAYIDNFVSSGSGGLDGLVGLTFGPDGNLYVSSHVIHSVKRFNGTTGAYIDDFVPSGSGGLNSAFDLVFGPDGNLYVISQGTNSVKRYNGTTGAYMGDFVVNAERPYGLRFGPDGNLYVTNRGTYRVSRYSGVNGAYMGDLDPLNLAGLDNPAVMTFGPDGYLYVGSSDSLGEGVAHVKRFDITSGAYLGDFTTFSAQPQGLAFWNGNLYVGGGAQIASIKRYDGATGAYLDDFIPAGSGGLTYPTSFVFSTGATISGIITLKGCQNSIQTLTFTLRPTDGSSNVVKTVTLAADGSFHLTNILRKSYTLHVKGSKWLARNVIVDASNGDVTGLTATLLPGDISGNNKVDIGDLADLADAFGTTPASPDWNENADLNCDGKVNILDLGLLASSYGKQGDP